MFVVFIRTSAVGCLKNGDVGAKEGAFLLYQTQDVVVNDEDVGVLAESLHLVIDQWIQYKLGKQYLWKKVTQPWESNPGPTPIRGELATIIVSVGLKKLVAIRHYIQVG